jgi:hypothetical protein
LVGEDKKEDDNLQALCKYIYNCLK